MTCHCNEIPFLRLMYIDPVIYDVNMYKHVFM